MVLWACKQASKAVRVSGEVRERCVIGESVCVSVSEVSVSVSLVSKCVKNNSVLCGVLWSCASESWRQNPSSVCCNYFDQ